ncbi:hypothetical protein [Flavobacterium gillisiae]|nr:hypothetical protein [Flavobacterium gillisiae]
MSQTAEINLDQISNQNKMKMARWYLEVTEKGIVTTDDSIKFSKEFIKVLNEKDYRDSLFPETYSWVQALHYVKHQQLRQAFWSFINLYPENETNKELVIKSILAYDEVFKMDEMLVNVFYTYSFMDPEISIIKDGRPEIVRPDILEEKLGNVKEMVAYVLKYREQKELKANKE